MQALSDSLARFKPPVITPERKAEIEEFERQEVIRKHKERVKTALVPQGFQSADIESCRPAVRDYAKQFSKDTSSGLILRGETGQGKTYSACAVLNFLLDDYLVRFATMGDILMEIRGAYGGRGTESDILHRWSNVRLLVIDDLGKEKPGEWALSMIFQLIDNRYRRGKPTIYTTQYNGSQLGERLAQGGEAATAEAIVSRMQQCRAVLLSGRDRRTRMHEHAAAHARTDAAG